MTKTKFFIIKTTLLLVSLLFAASAWGQSYKGDITVVPVRCEQSGDSLYVDMDIHLTDARVKSNMSVELVPCFASEMRDYVLPAVSIKGRSAYKAWERGVTMEGRNPDAGNGAFVLKGYKTDTIIKYRYTVPYETWMADAGLSLRKYDSGCGGSALTGVTNLAGIDKEAPAIIYYTPYLAYVVPEAEEVKRREEKVESRLDFVVNKTNIDPSYMNNPSELARIRSIIDELIGDEAITIVTIEIIGNASPEGNLAANQRLSEGRALSMQNYLISRYNFRKDIFRLTFGGENWDGLVRELQNNPIDHYGEVLDIIGTTPPDQTRKSRIAGLNGGATYRYMKANIYPMLRTVICRIEYLVKGFDTADAVEVYRRRPRNLNLNDFYMVAGTMREGSPEFVEVFETALRVYPDDEIANLNAAIAALQEKDTERAAPYLEKAVKIRNLPEYHNAMGALLLLQHDTAGARVHFEQAAGMLEAAGKNLRMISTQ